MICKKIEELQDLANNNTLTFIDFFCYSSNTVVLIIIGVLLIFAASIYLYGVQKTRWSWLWFIYISNIHRKQDWLGAVFWTSCVIALSMLIASFIMFKANKNEIDSLVSSPGIAAAFLAAFFTIWTLITARITKTQQEQQLASTEDMLESVTLELAKVNSSCADLNDNSEHKIYFMDYSPSIGIAASPDQYELMSRNLEFACNHPQVKANFVFYPKDKVKKFHQTMDIKQRLKDNIPKIITNYDEAQGVWCSSDIGQLHIIIINQVAYQYIVIPVENQTKSRSIGMKTEDAFVVRFLKDTVDTCIKKALTPEVKVIQNTVVDDVLELKFSTQENISKIHIDFSTNNEFFTESNNLLVIPAQTKASEQQEIEAEGIQLTIINVKVAEIWEHLDKHHQDDAEKIRYLRTRLIKAILKLEDLEEHEELKDDEIAVGEKHKLVVDKTLKSNWSYPVEFSISKPQTKQQENSATAESEE
jgi:hypothetical protein